MEHPINTMNQYDKSSVTVQSFPQQGCGDGGSPGSSRLIRDANAVQQFVQNFSSSSNDDDSSSSNGLLFYSSKEFLGVGNSDIENNNEDDEVVLEVK